MANVKIIPIAKIPEEKYLSMLSVYKSSALSTAQSLIPGKNTVEREIKPSDLGLTTPNFVFNLAAGDNTITITVPEDQVIQIEEIYNLTSPPAAVHIKFGTPSGWNEDIHLEHIYAYQPAGGMLTTPIKLLPKQEYKIQITATAASTAEKLIFRGTVREAVGKNVQP